jgi:putative ABC transport system permease protein
MTYIATARVSHDNEVPLQRALVTSLPNVTAIKVGDVLENVARLLQQIAWAVQGIALFCIVNGAVVMIAALSTTRFRRVYEAAVMKALGTTRRMIVQSFAVEFGLIGTLASLLGVGLASVLSWAVVYFFLDLQWTFHPDILVGALLFTILLTLAVGFLSTFRLLAPAPLAVLRHE